MGSLELYGIPILTLAALLGGLAMLLLIAEKLLVNYGTCAIDVNDGEQSVSVEGGGTLLAAMLDNGIHIPNACAGKGSCGYCKVTVLDGGGGVLPTEKPYLSRKELKSHVRLACQVKVRSDMKVKLVDFLETVKTMVTNKTYNSDLNWRFKLGRRPAVPADPDEIEDDFDDTGRKIVDDKIEEQKTVGFPEPSAGLIGLLQAVNEHYRYLPASALAYVSEKLDVPLSRTFSLATFYNSFSLTPKGRTSVKVCTGTACHVKGAPTVLERLERELNIKEGETTPNREYTLEGVRCLGCCGLAPVLTFDDEVHGKVKPADVPKLLEARAEANKEEAAAAV
jgi:NADH-quinone oxidoreductase subunit E